MIPNVKRALRRFEQPVVFIAVIKSNDENFQVVTTHKSREQRAVIQAAEKDKLNPSTIDWSLSYFTVHSRVPFYNGEILLYKGKHYKIIDVLDYDAYGFTKGTAEEIKNLGSVGL